MYTVIYRAELDGAKDKLRDVSGRMKDLRKPLKQAGEYMQLEVEDRGLSPRERSHHRAAGARRIRSGSISA